MRISGALQTKIAKAADRVGARDSLRAAYTRMSPLARRNARDDRNLRLLLAHGLASDANCIDVGAHSGDVLEQIVRVAPDGHHVAFEPLPEQAESLRRRFPGVDVRESAAAAEAGESSFVRVTSNPQLSGLRDRGFAQEVSERIPVRLERIDDIVDPDRRVSLLKVDVEGGELGVFEGAIELLRRDMPTVVFEHGVGGSDHFGTSSEQVHELLVSDVGLRLFDIDGNGPLDRRSFTALFEEPIWFYVAHR